MLGCIAAKDLLPLQYSGEKRLCVHIKINIAYALFTIEYNQHQSLIHNRAEIKKVKTCIMVT